MALHRNATGQANIHVIHAFEFADSTERAAGTGYTLTSADLLKVALQLDDNTMWILTDDSPITWAQIGAGSAANEDGWLAAGETWTYASADAPTFTFTIAGVDVTTKYTVGTRIKLTQTTPKYFIVTAVAFSTDTTVTVYGGTDYVLANAAITSPYFSRQKAPAGMPMTPVKWTVLVTDTSNAAQASPTSGTWYNPGTITISIPIGVWRVEYFVNAGCADSTATGQGANITLSTANNSESDKQFSGFYQTNGSSAVIDCYNMITRAKLLTLAAKTPYFLNIKSGFNVDSIQFRGDISTTLIQAICAYL